MIFEKKRENMPNPKKPLELAEKLGNTGKRKIGPISAVAVAVQERPEPPTGLRAGGVLLWETVTRSAAAWISESDLAELELLCRAQDQFNESTRRMELAEDDDLFLKYSLECRKLIDVMRPLFSSLGLNPVARSKLGLTVAATREINSKLSAWMS